VDIHSLTNFGFWKFLKHWNATAKKEKFARPVVGEEYEIDYIAEMKELDSASKKMLNDSEIKILERFNLNLLVRMLERLSD